MSVYNAESKGSELITISNDRKRSTQDIIINEDWCMVMSVISCTNGIISATKVWDGAAEKKVFYAELKYSGREGTPLDTTMEEGQHVVFHRVGEYNSNPLEESAGFELRAENPDKVSWVCFLDSNPIIWVYDNGDGSGYEAIYSGSGWSQVGESLDLVATDPLTQYYTNTPPWCEGRVMLGQKHGDNFIVYLSGFGSPTKIFTFDAGGVTFTLVTDSSGKVTDFSGN